MPGIRSSHFLPTLLLFALPMAWSQAEQDQGTMINAPNAPAPSTSGERRVIPDRSEIPAHGWGGSGKPVSSSEEPRSTLLPADAPISVGDVLQISEFNTPSLSGNARVGADGKISLPLIGDIAIAGLTSHEAQDAIEKKLIDRGMIKNPQVSVFVSLYATQDISVLGEVARPGVYPYAQHHTLLDVVSAAGGLTPTAGSAATVYHRDDPEHKHSLVLDLVAAHQGGNNPVLQAGDTVVVKKAALVYVVGDVMRPGGFPLDPTQRVTVVQAIAMAWGTGQYAALPRAKLIRESGQGRVEIDLNLKRILDGRAADLALQDHDILYIPRSGRGAAADRAVNAVVQAAVGAAIYAPIYY